MPRPLLLPRWQLCVVLLLLPGPRVDSAQYYWNVASPNNTELERNISASVRTIVFGQVALLNQHFGHFPCLGCGPNKTDMYGGIPQRSDLSQHIAAVSRDLDTCSGVGLYTHCVPPNFTGFVVVDYESWRANWGWTSPTYREASINHTRTRSPQLNATALAAAAEQEYNASAMAFLIATLRTIRAKRPHLMGLGMYDYPLGLYYPFGFGINGSCGAECPPSDCPHPQCGAGQRAQDNAMMPLYKEMTALHPSLYLTHPSDWNATDARHNQEFIFGAVAESFRVAALVGLPPSAVVPYTWYRYHDRGPASLQLLSDSDAALEFAATAHQQLDKVERYLIYGAESPCCHGVRVQQTSAFFTRHASLLNRPM